MDSCDSLLVMKKNAHLKHCALISLDFSNAKRLCSFFIQSVDQASDTGRRKHIARRS